jgi:hypothetical protein
MSEAAGIKQTGVGKKKTQPGHFCVGRGWALSNPGPMYAHPSWFHLMQFVLRRVCSAFSFSR